MFIFYIGLYFITVRNSFILEVNNILRFYIQNNIDVSDIYINDIYNTDKTLNDIYTTLYNLNTILYLEIDNNTSIQNQNILYSQNNNVDIIHIILFLDGIYNFIVIILDEMSIENVYYNKFLEEKNYIKRFDDKIEYKKSLYKDTYNLCTNIIERKKYISYMRNIEYTTLENKLNCKDNKFNRIKNKTVIKKEKNESKIMFFIILMIVSIIGISILIFCLFGYPIRFLNSIYYYFFN